MLEQVASFLFLISGLWPVAVIVWFSPYPHVLQMYLAIPLEVQVAALNILLICQSCPVALTGSVLVWLQTVQVYSCSPLTVHVGALMISPGCHLWPPRDGLVSTSIGALQRVQR